MSHLLKQTANLFERRPRSGWAYVRRSGTGTVTGGIGPARQESRQTTNFPWHATAKRQSKVVVALQPNRDVAWWEPSKQHDYDLVVHHFVPNEDVLKAMQFPFSEIVSGGTIRTKYGEHVFCGNYHLRCPLRNRQVQIGAENVYLGIDSFFSECGRQTDDSLWWWWKR